MLRIRKTITNKIIKYLAKRKISLNARSWGSYGWFWLINTLVFAKCVDKLKSANKPIWPAYKLRG